MSSKAWTLLTARALPMEPAIGGLPTLTPALISTCLQGLDRGPFLAAMVKELHDPTQILPLEQQLFDQLEVVARSHWKLRGEDREKLWPLAGTAVFEFVIERPKVCSRCQNRGYLIHSGNGVQCEACEGRTGKVWSKRDRAEYVGVPWSSWRFVWEARYELAHSIVCGWHGEADAHLRRALREIQEAA
jgi:hypothetical protein